MTKAAPEAEAELEAFRQQWRREVSARNQQPGRGRSHAGSSTTSDRASGPVINVSKLPRAGDETEELEPRSYHDLPDESSLSQGGALNSSGLDSQAKSAPQSALEHYEHAVEREAQGQLGDSVRHYRAAFKLDDGVHEAYKEKHFPLSQLTKSKNTAKPVEGSSKNAQTSSAGIVGLPPSLKEMIFSFASLSIEPPPPATDLSPPTRSFLGELPEEILVKILSDVAILDVAAFVRLVSVCKRLAFLVTTEEQIWKRIALRSFSGFTGMHYDFACEIDGKPLETFKTLTSTGEPEASTGGIDERQVATEHQVLINDPETRRRIKIAHSQALLSSDYALSWRNMYKSRPRIRFNGCYISTVIYNRPGAHTNNLSWTNPVHIVTYHRYLRFFRDGTVISLLTTSEPKDVVHHLTKANLHAHHRSDSALPSAVMKDALGGRWRLSGPSSTYTDPITGQAEVEGDLHIETLGVIPRYTYRMHMSLSHAGKSTRNNKLAWVGFWSYNRLTDDWAEFFMKNDRPFYWSRVKSYGLGKE